MNSIRTQTLLLFASLCLPAAVFSLMDSPRDGWIVVDRFSYAENNPSYEFYSLTKFGVRSGDLDNKQIDTSYHYNVDDFDVCLQAAGQNNVNLTIWDECERKCTFKYTSTKTTYAFYTGQGKALAHYDVYGYDDATSQDREEVKKWLAEERCHMILQLVDWPSVHLRTFKCKRYPENKCQTMIFRKLAHSRIADL